MNFEERIGKAAILGAAGKMGSGILLLIARLMATMKLEHHGYDPKVTAIDVSPERLKAILKYVEKQSSKYALKNADKVSAWYPGKDAEAAAADFSRDVLSCIRTATDASGAYDAHVVFEAVNENKDLKISIFRDIEEHNPHHPFYLTNTSSVPIHLLDDGAGLGGRIIGFHFYNPPAVQKLVELIPAKNTLDEVHSFALELAARLRKVVVPSNDVAGFIGNGHFMRDVLFGFDMAGRLSDTLGLPGAMLAVDVVTREYLIRPMGILQLSDYVGLDVVRFIMEVMNPHFPDEDLHVPMLDRFTADGVLGGQNPDGSQKNGIFRYEEGKITGVYDPDTKDYIGLADIEPGVRKYLGPVPGSMKPWKEVIRDPQREEILKLYFQELKENNTQGAVLAREFGKNSGNIGRKLVDDGVAHNVEDVNTVMLTGFYHAYGPVNTYF